MYTWKYLCYSAIIISKPFYELHRLSLMDERKRYVISFDAVTVGAGGFIQTCISQCFEIGINIQGIFRRFIFKYINCFEKLSYRIRQYNAIIFLDYEEGLAYARQTGKPVLIDFTGYGCVNCRKMEAFVLADDSVKARLQNYVFIELFVDDKRDGIGDKNSRIQREQFGSNAQPYYVQLDAKGDLIAPPIAFTTDPAEFINWLKY